MIVNIMRSLAIAANSIIETKWRPSEVVVWQLNIHRGIELQILAPLVTIVGMIKTNAAAPVPNGIATIDGTAAAGIGGVGVTIGSILGAAATTTTIVGGLSASGIKITIGVH